MKFIEVNNKATARMFLEMPVDIYKNDPKWIRPLDKDIELVFDQEQNKFFRHGEAVRWVLQNDEGKPVGRVAAYINRKKLDKDLPVGGMGFFECVNDQSTADALFNKCEEWLEERGMKGMDGPINFGERDRWWGLLVEGFEEPTYCMNYHRPYYRELFENYGFQLYFRQYCYSYEVGQPVPQRFKEAAEKIAGDDRYSFRYAKKSELEKYGEDFLEIYNDAWGGHYGFKKMDRRQAMAILNSIKPIMEEELMWFGYYDEKPIAFFLMLPELNQIFKYMNGKFGLWEKLKFLYYRWRGVNRKMFGILFGIVPAHQGKGVEGAIINAAEKVIKPMRKYDELEMIWIGDFNPKMIGMVEKLDAKRKKIYHTYRKYFDPSIPFKRAPILNGSNQKN
ncbi:MAG: hypothetical protein WD077_13985 [Bacteroidia bacterium]